MKNKNIILFKKIKILANDKLLGFVLFLSIFYSIFVHVEGIPKKPVLTVKTPSSSIEALWKDCPTIF